MELLMEISLSLHIFAFSRHPGAFLPWVSELGWYLVDFFVNMVGA